MVFSLLNSIKWGNISAGYSRNGPKGDQQIPGTRCIEIEACAEKQTIPQRIEQENRFHQYESKFEYYDISIISPNAVLNRHMDTGD